MSWRALSGSSISICVSEEVEVRRDVHRYVPLLRIRLWDIEVHSEWDPEPYNTADLEEQFVESY